MLIKGRRMHERLAAARTGLAMALVYTLPLLLWLLGQAFQSSVDRFDLGPSLGGMMITAPLLQSCSLALCLPWLMRFPAPGERCCAVAMLLLVPARCTRSPAWRGGQPHSPAIALLVLAALALVLLGVYAACLRRTVPGQARSLLLLCTQLIMVGLCWQGRDIWPQVLSL